MSELPVTVIVLGAQRTGVVNPLATKAGVSHKCLVPICDEPLVLHVIRTLTSLNGIKQIRIVVEADAQEAVGAVIAPCRASGIPIEFVDSKANIVESVIAGAGDEEGPIVVTTADNVLLTPDGFNQLRSGMANADATIGLTTKERVWAAHREGQRNFYEFKDAGYANCNLYGLSNRKAFAAAEVFRGGGQFKANARRMVSAFGLFNIILMRMGWITLPDGFKRLSKRFGVNIEPIVFEDGALAIDVDNDRTYDCADTIMKERKPAA